ncbi:hypothetical protein IT408_02830 [Candidatus Uhrbacteria bacterium]|nr:hypothetical protein [Candidatus Uhrbacteria bacterium]
MMKEIRQTEKATERKTVLRGFEVKPDFITTYEPKLIGRGGEHMVFTLKGKPDLVAKVNMNSVERFYPATIHEIDPLHGYENRWQSFLDDHRKRRMALREAFGAEHVLTQKVFLAKVPFVIEMKFALKQLAEQNAGFAPKQVWAIVSLQKKSELLGKEGTKSIRSGYVERRGAVNEEGYALATQQLLNGEGISEQVFRTIQGKHMEDLIDEMKQDQGIKDTMKEFTEKAIQFTTNQPRACLDLAGEENIVVGKKNGKVNFEIIDPFAGMITLDQVQDAWRRFAKNQPLKGSDRYSLLNGINYIRTINGLSVLSDSVARLPLLPEGVQLNRFEGRRLFELLSQD